MKVQSTEYLVHSKCSMNVEYDNGEEEEKNEEWEKKQEEKNEEVVSTSQVEKENSKDKGTEAKRCNVHTGTIK